MKKHPFVLMVLILLVAACGTAPAPVIDKNPKDLIIQPSDLPAGGNYGSGAQSAYPNSMFNSDYVTQSKRVYAYGVTYTRGNNNLSPASITDEAILYKDADGANYSLKTYFPSLCVSPSYAIVNDFFVGDGTIVCTQVANNAPGTQNIYWIYFIYKNVGHLLTGSGLPGEVSPGFMQSLAQTAYKILQATPVNTTVTFSP